MSRKAWILVIACVAGLMLTVVGIWFLVFVPRVSGEFEVDWRTTGQPFVVEGRVVDQSGHPATDVPVVVETMSGDELVSTDGDGYFRVKVGELEIVGLRIAGKDCIRWDSAFGQSVSQGVWFDIQCLREDLPPRG